jgi:hypothetical protein
VNARASSAQMWQPVRSLVTVSHHHAVAHVGRTFLSSRCWPPVNTESKTSTTSSMGLMVRKWNNYRRYLRLLGGQLTEPLPERSRSLLPVSKCLRMPRQ